MRLFLLFLCGVLIFAKGLEHSKWKLVRVSPGDEKISSSVAAEISFDGGRFMAQVCNTSIGAYRIEDNKLLIPAAVASTRKACLSPIEEWDQRLNHLLSSKPNIDLTGERMTLAAPDGTKWTFQGQPIPSPQAKTKFIYVASTIKHCTGVMPMECYTVRESRDQPWTVSYIPIIGFSYVPGIEYRLRIKEDRVRNPPTDVPSVKWYLDMIVEQTVVDRKAADDYLASHR